MKAFLFGVLGLFILAGVLLAGLNGMTTQTVQNESASTSSINEQTDVYTIKIDYPQFGLPAIDAQIRDDINQAVMEFKDLPANPPESAAAQNSFDGSYETAYVGPDIVSVKLILSQYTGGAHPMTILSGENFDRATARKLYLDDVLPLIGRSTAQVSEEATALFKEKFGDVFFEEGSNTNPENFSSFVVDADQVTFIFQPYQVAAYAAGPQEVSFARVK